MYKLSRSLVWLLFISLLSISCYLMVQSLTNPERHEEKSPLIGQALPKFSLLTHEGIELNDRDFLNQISVLHVWASWCKTCQVNHQLLEALKKKTHIPIFGISYRSDLQRVISSLKHYTRLYKKNALDFQGHTCIHLGVAGTPEIYVLDKKGIIRYKRKGMLTEEIITKNLIPLIDELQQNDKTT